MMHDAQMVMKGLRLLELQDDVVATLDWMITHFDYDRTEVKQWGDESDEIKAAKKLRDDIKNA